MGEDWLHVMDEDGHTPLSRALRCGNSVIAALMLSLDQEHSNASTSAPIAIHEAARFGRAKEVRESIEKGADFGSMDQYGLTPLHWASLNGCLDLVRLLINRGADLNVHSVQVGCFTPLDLAKLMGYTEIVEFLGAHGGMS